MPHIVRAMSATTPQDAPIGCPRAFLRYLYHSNRIDYCSTLIVMALSVLSSEDEAVALAKEDRPTVVTAGEEMAAKIIDLGGHSYQGHIDIAMVTARW